jgi:Restriction endonuclease EcoRII, N-terminal
MSATPAAAAFVISKILSHNDTGQSGAHQAGILVPKSQDILTFFPPLGRTEKNPRVHLEFIDDNDTKWIFAFIYYNNAYYGGTRNEFRLTCMTQFIHSNNLKAGDELIFTKEASDYRRISFKRTNATPMIVNGVLHLGSEWKVISISSRRT